jgi:hypothetical protein
MASEEGGQVGRASRLLSTAKSMVKALSGGRPGSPPNTPPKSSSPDHLGGENADVYRYGGDLLNSTPEDLFMGMAYREGISSPVPEMHRENESAAFDPEIGLRSEEIRSKSPKIRSLRGKEAEERKVEASFISLRKTLLRHTFCIASIRDTFKFGWINFFFSRSAGPPG